MTRRALWIGCVAALALAAAGCGGGNDEGGADAVGGECDAAKAELLSTVSERDRLFVDLQLDNASKACTELTPGTEEACSTARADLADAASQETPPTDVEARVDSAVEACAGTTITSTLPAP